MAHALPAKHAWWNLGSSVARWPCSGDAPLGLPSACALLTGCGAVLALPRLPPVALLLVLGLGAAWSGFRRSWVLAAMLAGMAWCGLQAHHALSLQWAGPPAPQAITVSGRITGLPVHEARRTRFEFLVDAGPEGLRGRRLRLGWFDEDASARRALQAGSRWSMPVLLRAPRGLRNPGAVDAEMHAMLGRITATGHVAEPLLATRLAPPGGIDAWREATSLRIGEALPPASARFIQAMAIGDTRGLNDADWTVLRATGLTHLIAISGFHVGIVAGFGALLASGLWWLWPALASHVPRQHASGLAAVMAAAGYAALAGGALPTVRTVVMIAVLVAARLLRRRQQGFDALALALVAMLAMDPLSLLSAGFWLSFAGVAWLLWCLPPEATREPTAWRRMLRDLVAAQAVATLGLLPLTVFLFGQASVLGPLANLLAVPWWSLVVVPLSLLGVLLESLVPGSGQWAWQLAAAAFDPTWKLFGHMAGSELAMAWLPEGRWFAAPLALGGAAWLLMPRGLPGRWLAVALWLPLSWPAPDRPARGEAELVMIDVGQGTSVLVRTATHDVLYDMGPAQPDGYDAGERAVLPTLRALGVRRLDAALVSHGDNDHAGGWPSVSAALPVMASLAPEGSPVPGLRPCVAGLLWRWDGVTFRVLHPTPGFPYLANESSCVLRVETAHDSALLTGDIGRIIERKLVREQHRWLHADVVAVPHHGSDGSSDPAFVAATGARLALVSSGADNRFRHPRPGVVRRWCEAGADVRDTASAGALRVRLGADGLFVNERRRDRQRPWDAARRRGQDGRLCY